ncbi:MAG: DUF1127 domain-containing protein [Pseudomonadota bacterium]
MTRRWRQRQRAVEQLQALDDRLLHDIGITRSEIIAAVCGVPSDATGKTLKRQPSQAQRLQPTNNKPISP